MLVNSVTLFRERGRGNLLEKNYSLYKEKAFVQSIFINNRSLTIECELYKNMRWWHRSKCISHFFFLAELAIIRLLPPVGFFTTVRTLEKMIEKESYSSIMYAFNVKDRQNYQLFKRRGISPEWLCTIHTCDSSLPALLIQRIVSRWSLSVRINLFSQRSQRVLAKGVKTAELVRSTLFVAAPSKRSLIQHFYEGGQNPFRTIRRPSPLPPQGRDGLNAHLAIVLSRLLSNRIKANTALWADEEFAQRDGVIYRQKDGETYGIRQIDTTWNCRRRLRPWKIQSLRTRVDIEGTRSEGGMSRTMYSVTLNYYLPISASYRPLVSAAHQFHHFLIARQWRVSGRWKIEIFKSGICDLSNGSETRIIPISRSWITNGDLDRK